MPVISRVYLTFLVSVLIPGVVLTYLSLRTIQHEKDLLRRSDEIRQEQLLTAIEKTLKKSESEDLETIQRLLVQSSASASARNYFFLATDLLKSRLIQYVIVLEKGHMVMPAIAQASMTPPRVSPIHEASATKVMDQIQSHFHGKNFKTALSWINRFFSMYPSVELYGPLGSPYHRGLKLLRIQCYKQMGDHQKTILYGKQFIDDILDFETFSDYQQTRFYLEETLSILSAMENLPTSLRDYLWTINLRSRSFYKNVSTVIKHWQPDVEFLAQIKGKNYRKGLQIIYVDGHPHLKILFPWIDSRSQVIARLNQNLYTQLIRSEVLNNSGHLWQNMDYAVYNLNNNLIDAPEGIKGKNIALERIINAHIHQWKIAVFNQGETVSPWIW